MKLMLGGVWFQLRILGLLLALAAVPACQHGAAEQGGVPLAADSAAGERSQGRSQSQRLGEQQLTALLDQGDFALLSAQLSPEREAGMVLPLRQRQQHLEQDLQALGYTFVKVIGVYQGLVEESLLVQGQPLSDCEVLRLGRRYGQESVIISHQGHHALVYTTGPHRGQAVLGQGWSQGGGVNQDHSRIELGPGRWFRFVLHLDFAGMRESAAAKRCG